MRILLLLLFLSMGYCDYSQCPYTAPLSTSAPCLGATITVTSTHTLVKIEWYNGNVLLDTESGTTAGKVTTAAGGNGAGSAANQLKGPSKIFIDPANNLYIADAANDRIQKWAPGATVGVTVAGGNGRGAAGNQLNNPMGVYLDGAGNIYIADAGNYRVQEWAPGASSGKTVAGGNGAGSADNQFLVPASVFVSSTGSIYVTDYSDNSRVQKWYPGAKTGITVAGSCCNGPGSAGDQLDHPTDAYVNGDSDVYVADYGNNRIEKWAFGATEGIVVAGGQGAGSGATQLNGPMSVFVDYSYNIYISDYGNNRVQRWPPTVFSGVTVAGGNGAGAASNQLNGPGAVFLGYDGNLYVDDINNNRVQLWGFKSTINNRYTPGTTGSFAAVVTDINGCIARSPSLIVNQWVTPTNYISIQDDQTVCVPNSFKAFITDGGLFPQYQWRINGVNAGTNSPTFVAPGILDGDVVDCILTADAVCMTDTVITSNSVKVSGSYVPLVSVSASDTTVCPGTKVVFKASSRSGGSAPSYQWRVNGVNTGSGGDTYTNSSLANGDVVTCQLTSNASCVITPTGVSAPIVMTVYPAVGPPVISSSATEICAGTPVSFNAVPSNNVSSPVFQWMVNSTSSGSNDPAYSSSKLANGDVVTCIIIDADGCLSPPSNRVLMLVHLLPVIAPAQPIAMQDKKGVTLHPDITGNIKSYLWQPGASLSDSTIADPVATPKQIITYALYVVSKDGCATTGYFEVNPFADLFIPNAFTPNKDGRNDVFYVLSGPPGSRIRDFLVFDRWGQRVYSAHDIIPGDASQGWNGDNKGAPAATGSYVYIVTVRLADGRLQTYRGSIMLIR